MRNVHSLGFTISAYFCLLMLGACASLGLEPAQSFDERLAYAVSQNAAARQAAANSRDAGEIEVTDAQFVLKVTDEARTLLDAARVAADVGDISSAEGRLSLATSILVNLQAYLRERSKK